MWYRIRGERFIGESGSDRTLRDGFEGSLREGQTFGGKNSKRAKAQRYETSRQLEAVSHG